MKSHVRAAWFSVEACALCSHNERTNGVLCNFSKSSCCHRDDRNRIRPCLCRNRSFPDAISPRISFAWSSTCVFWPMRTCLFWYNFERPKCPCELRPSSIERLRDLLPDASQCRTVRFCALCPIGSSRHRLVIVRLNSKSNKWNLCFKRF